MPWIPPPPPPQSPQVSEEALFDGGMLARNLERFLGRMNTALAGADAALPDFEIKEIWLSLTVDIGGNVSLAGLGGLNLERTRSFQFILNRKARS